MDDLVNNNALCFPALDTLIAQDLSLTSLSALAELVNTEDFVANDVIVWNFADSTLRNTADNKAHVQTIRTKLDDKFISPTIRTIVLGGSSGVTTHSITVADTENGQVNISPAKASNGTTVTITITPDTGYALENLTITEYP